MPPIRKMIRKIRKRNNSLVANLANSKFDSAVSGFGLKLVSLLDNSECRHEIGRRAGQPGIIV